MQTNIDPSHQNDLMINGMCEFNHLELFQQVNKLYSKKILNDHSEHILDNF